MLYPIAIKIVIHCVVAPRGKKSSCNEHLECNDHMECRFIPWNGVVDEKSSQSVSHVRRSICVVLSPQLLSLHSTPLHSISPMALSSQQPKALPPAFRSRLVLGVLYTQSLPFQNFLKERLDSASPIVRTGFHIVRRRLTTLSGGLPCEGIVHTYGIEAGNSLGAY